MEYLFPSLIKDYYPYKIFMPNVVISAFFANYKKIKQILSLKLKHSGSQTFLVRGPLKML
jgi:hypothetical protein